MSRISGYDCSVKEVAGVNLILAFGKYCPKVTIVSSDTRFLQEDRKGKYLDIRDLFGEKNPDYQKYFDGDVYSINGQFRVNLKGNKVFDLTKSGHVMYAVIYGGSGNTGRGYPVTANACGKQAYLSSFLKNYKFPYKVDGRSNGGGQGIYYYVVEDSLDLEKEYARALAQDVGALERFCQR